MCKLHIKPRLWGIKAKLCKESAVNFSELGEAAMGSFTGLNNR